jgi:hypothetical protein
MLADFANITGCHDARKISATWSEYYHDLAGARGVFVVDDPQHTLTLPGDHDFCGRGFLRCLMASPQLLNVQNRESGREFRYSAPIFCDTNFVSYCGAYFAGADLGPNADAFTEAVSFLLPLTNNLNALAYVMENAENPDTDKIKETLIGFIAMRQTPSEDFRRNGAFAEAEKGELERIVDVILETMRGPDFLILHQWAKEHYTWAKVVLLKSTLIAFTSAKNAVESRMKELLQFLHNELARFPQFGIYVAFRFFSLNAQEPFFSAVQQNAAALERTLNSMAWDLAHWTNLFDLTNMHSSKAPDTAFPIPHFLSFDRRFIRLSEKFKLDGIIYAANAKRCEQFYARPILRAVSDLLEGPLGELNTAQAIADRRRRVAKGEQVFDERLSAVEAELSEQLRKFCENSSQDRRLAAIRRGH